jgi:hypothetical protein
MPTITCAAANYSHARFNAANRPEALPETIGYVSTASLDEEQWDEFWEKISHVNAGEQIGSVVFLQHALMGYCWVLVWLAALWYRELKNGYYAVTMLAFILYASPWFWWNSYKLSKIRDICAEYTPVFQAAGFRIECQMEYPEHGYCPMCYYLYVYPSKLEHQCITIADETIFGSYCSKYPVLPSKDNVSKIGALVTSELWDEFWTKLEIASTDYSRVYQQYRGIAIIALMTIVVIPMVGNLINLGRTFQEILLGICVVGISFLDSKVHRKFIFHAWGNLAGAETLYSWRFNAEHDVQVELRKEYNLSRIGLFNHLASHWRWRLYIFELQPPNQRCSDRSLLPFHGR